MAGEPLGFGLKAEAVPPGEFVLPRRVAPCAELCMCV